MVQLNPPCLVGRLISCGELADKVSEADDAVTEVGLWVKNTLVLPVETDVELDKSHGETLGDMQMVDDVYIHVTLQRYSSYTVHILHKVWCL